MYNKLFTKILDSSIWLEPTTTRIVWLTFLAAMDEDGFCQFASVPNLAHRARVTLEEAAEAVRCLESPDPHSSDPDNDGRRIEKVPGGWMILNAQKYRDLVTRTISREQTRLRVAKHRTAKKGNAPVTACNAPVTQGNGSVTQSETKTKTKAETETDIRATGCPGRLPESENQDAGSPINLALIDWSSAVRFAEAAAKRVPARNDKERRQFLKYAAMAAAMFGEAWLVGAGDGVVLSEVPTRETVQARYVGILQLSAAEKFGIDEKAFGRMRKAIEVPDDIWHSQFLGGCHCKTCRATLP